MNPQEKIKYLNEHLHYEVVMMRWAFGKIPSVPPSLLQNTFIECFAVHARGLYDFLTNKADSRNALAEDFLAEHFKPDTTDISPKITKLNQQIFHTGTQRTDDPALKFNTEDGAKVLQWVEDTLGEFAEKLPPKYPTEWLPARPLSVRVSQNPGQSSSPRFLDSGTTTTFETISWKGIPKRNDEA